MFESTTNNQKTNTNEIAPIDRCSCSLSSIRVAVIVARARRLFNFGVIAVVVLLALHRLARKTNEIMIQRANTESNKQKPTLVAI